MRLLEYIQARHRITNEKYLMAPHIPTMCRAIERCIAGNLPDGRKNLMINIPPRWSKTTTLRCAMEMGLGLIPDSEFMAASYAVERARETAVKVRNTMDEPWYQNMFPACRRDKQSAQRNTLFQTTMGGSIYAAGVNGSILGFGAGKLRESFSGFYLIDDPIKPKDAKSPTMRAGCIDFYRDSVKTRLNSPNTPIILIMQRLHPMDLCGYIEQEEPGDWVKLAMPAYDEVNEKSNWEERISTKYLQQLREVDPTGFYTQYQQKPVMPGGTVLKEIWFKPHYYTDWESVQRKCDIIFATADTAYKTNKKNDASSIQLWGIDSSGPDLYLLDRINGRWAFPDLVNNVREFYRARTQSPYLNANVRGLFIEAKASGISLVQTLQTQGISAIEWLPSQWNASDDKVGRAKDFAWLGYAGKVHLPDLSIAPWMEEMGRELWDFTEDDSHEHDDDVDGATIAGSIFKLLTGM
jgi:predicted phage terminase large subunit-like protein